MKLIPLAWSPFHQLTFNLKRELLFISVVSITTPTLIYSNRTWQHLYAINHARFKENCRNTLHKKKHRQIFCSHLKKQNSLPLNMRTVCNHRNLWRVAETAIYSIINLGHSRACNPECIAFYEKQYVALSCRLLTRNLL